MWDGAWSWEMPGPSRHQTSTLLFGMLCLLNVSFTLVQENIFQSTSCIGQVLNWRKMSEREQLKHEGNRSKTIYYVLI